MRHQLPWQPLPATAPALLNQLLTVRSSLTKKLEQLTGSSVAIDVRRNQLMLASSAENHFIDVAARQRIWLRDINLTIADESWVLARTAIPYQPQHEIYRQLSQFGEKPIGTFLFSHRDLQRETLMYCCCDLKTLPFFQCFQDIPLPNKPIWARRSRFVLQQLTFSVTEFFVHPCLW